MHRSTAKRELAEAARQLTKAQACFDEGAYGRARDHVGEAVKQLTGSHIELGSLAREERLKHGA